MVLVGVFCVCTVLAGGFWSYSDAQKHDFIIICEVSSHTCGEIPKPVVTAGPQGDAATRNCIGLKDDERYFCRPDYAVFDRDKVLPAIKRGCQEGFTQRNDHTYGCTTPAASFDMFVGHWQP
ncbi:MAG: hypothetical protein JWL82_296 [Parcubacteria group bacterium]|nr:hypothetical protein [Parcubacteria group bacterium]